MRGMKVNGLLVCVLSLSLLFSQVVSAEETSPPETAPEYEPQVEDYLLSSALALTSNFVAWGWGRVVLESDYSDVSWGSIERNFKVGFEWDADQFPTNMLGHPYQGSIYHGSARASNLGFWTASLYAFFGSLQWEFFMENELPSYNDLIVTTFGGMAGGEVLYRLSMEVLDPSTSGFERFGREFAATLISPANGVTRLIKGESWAPGERVSEPRTKGAVMLGPDMLRAEDSRRPEFKSVRLGLLLQYGDLKPREDFKPYDWFLFSGSINASPKGFQRASLDSTGLLARWNFGCGGGCVVGINQHFAYNDTPVFQVGTTSIGGSFMGDLTIGENWSLRAGLHLNWIALGGFNALGATTIEREYNLGTGGMSRVFGWFRWRRSDSPWFNHFELRLSNTRYFLRTLSGANGMEYAGVTSGHFHIPIYDSLGFVLGVEIYDRQTLPDQGDNLFSSYYTEQAFLLWKF